MDIKHFISAPHTNEVIKTFDDDHPPVLEIQENNFSVTEQPQGSDLAYLLGDDYYIENGIIYQKQNNNLINSKQKDLNQSNNYFSNKNQQIIEDTPNFNSNVCCGLCGSILTYELLINEHLPNIHPEVLANGVVDLEEIPYETWLNEQPLNSSSRSRSVRAGFGTKFNPEKLIPNFRHVHSTRQLRRISQYRVNTSEMSLPELELALQRKMVEKLGRKIPVTLVDKLHAKCGICDTVISLNKKFEIVHLVRHFNAWHPSTHKCAGTWPNKESNDSCKPLSSQDFAVIDTDPNSIDNLQCIWCGMFLSSNAIGMHFHEIHPEEVEVPKCNLCMQELLINARLYERFREDFGITMPDEHTFRSIKFKRDFNSEQKLEKAIIKYLKRINEGCNPEIVDIEDLDNSEIEEDEETDELNNELPSCDAFANSRMICGRRSKPKRKFITPIVRQAAPENSPFVTPITHSHWKCLLCHLDIYAAVISAGVIKHYKKYHPMQLPEVQLELCKARLDKISNKNMLIFGNERDKQKGTCSIECQICTQTFPMTPPFNICRAIRHIKMKHPEVMPEHNGGENKDTFSPPKFDYSSQQRTFNKPNIDIEDDIIYATELTDPTTLEMLYKNYSILFTKAFSISNKNINQRIFILTQNNENLNALDVEEVIRVRDPLQDPMVVVLNRAGKT
uniref:C2H2-type domain-containing protein n=1 Tax=Meloidogyne hapla TaxID=6305 RepID=A0A1I8C222_MELHA